MQTAAHIKQPIDFLMFKMCSPNRLHTLQNSDQMVSVATRWWISTRRVLWRNKSHLFTENKSKQLIGKRHSFCVPEYAKVTSSRCQRVGIAGEFWVANPEVDYLGPSRYLLFKERHKIKRITVKCFESKFWLKVLAQRIVNSKFERFYEKA